MRSRHEKYPPAPRLKGILNASGAPPSEPGLAASIRLGGAFVLDPRTALIHQARLRAL